MFVGFIERKAWGRGCTAFHRDRSRRAFGQLNSDAAVRFGRHKFNRLAKNIALKGG
jgi:hypothetical protein